MKTPIVFFDLETSGLLPSHPNIQIAAIAVDMGALVHELGRFQRRIKFDETLADPEALKINHYDRDLWEREAVPEVIAIREFSEFLKRYPAVSMVSKRTGRPYSVAKLAGHYAADFDGPRLKAMFQRHGEFLPADPRVRCTVQRALWWFEETGSAAPRDFKLATLCEYFGIPVPSTHEALADVGLAVQLWLAMSVPRVGKQQEVAT